MKKESLKINFIYNIVYQILVLILPLITAPYLSRIIGSEGIGVYSYTQAFANYFVLVILLGVENYGNREIAKTRDNAEKRDTVFWSIFLIQFFLMIVLTILYLGYVLITNPDYATIYILQIFYVISAGFNINWYFFGTEKFKITVTRNMVIKVITTILIFIFVKNTHDLWLYALIISLGTLISNMVVWPFLLKEVKFRKINWKSVKVHILPNLILFLPVIAVSLYNIMDKLMLGSMSTYQEVGYYTYAEKIVQVPITVIIALGTVMMPHVSNLFSKGKEEECKVLFDKAMLFVIFTSSAFMFGMANLAPGFSILYYGSGFERCGLFMMILSPVIIFKSWANLVRTQYIIPKEYDGIYIISVSLGAIVNLIINMCLIPRYAGIGAIIGTIFAEFVVCFVQTWKTRKEINFKPYFLDCFCFCLIGFIMYTFMEIIGNRFVLQNMLFANVVIRFICGALIYIILSIIYLLIVKKDKKTVMSIIASVRSFKIK